MTTEEIKERNARIDTWRNKMPVQPFTTWRDAKGDQLYIILDYTIDANSAMDEICVMNIATENYKWSPVSAFLKMVNCGALVRNVKR